MIILIVIVRGLPLSLQLPPLLRLFLLFFLLFLLGRVVWGKQRHSGTEWLG